MSSLAKMPEAELGVVEDVIEIPMAGAEAPAVGLDGAEPHILDDGVGGAEASDHIDDMDGDGEPDAG